MHHFLAKFLAHNNKMSEKSAILQESLNSKMTPRSFPVSGFALIYFVSNRKWIFTVLVHQNTGKKDRHRIFFAYTDQYIVEKLSRIENK